MSRLVAYNFLAVKNGLAEIDDINEGVGRFLPKYWYSVFDIDKQEVIATLYTSRYGFDVVKVANNKVTEHYKTGLGFPYKTFDLISGEPLEYYKFEGLDLVKYDVKTNQKTGFTTNCTYNTLPEEYKALVKSDAQLVYWANKPYGRVVGIIEV